MKFTRKMKALLLTLSSAALFVTGCSLLENGGSGSITFRIDGETAEKIALASRSQVASASRAITGEEMGGGSLYFEIELKGGYAAKEILPATEGASVTFTDIPAETKVYAEATAYKIENDGKQILYTGRSEEITIQEGENSLSLVMKKTEPVEPSEPEEPSEPTEPEPTEPTPIPDEPEPVEPEPTPEEPEPVEPSEPVDPAEPSEPADPEPSEPVDPAEPEPIEYTITFVLDGGQWEEGYTAPASCAEGEKLAEPEKPAKASSETASYFFEGWYTSADGGETLSETPYDFDSPVTAELTLYAKWKEVPSTEITATISVEESSDISVTVDKDETDSDKGIIIYTFTAEEGYESYTWKLDGEEVTATSSAQNTFTFNTRGAAAGTYDISLIAKKLVVEATEESPAQYEYYSYEAHITVE